MHPRKLPLLVLPALLAGCVTAEFIQTNPMVSPPRDPSTVAVYRTGRPPQPSREIGWIRVTSGQGYRAGLDALVNKAAQHGCDAVSDIRSNYSRGNEEMTGSCFVFLAARGGAGNGRQGAP